MDDTLFRRLLTHHTRSWAGYRKVRKGVKKRLARHMSELGCRDLTSYLRRIDVDAVAAGECERRLTVAISRFFRDRQLWHDLGETLLPARIRDRHDTFRVWSAGCAAGEEAYSFRIVWTMLGEVHGCMPELEVVASDLNPENIERARVGCYESSSLRELPASVRDRFFEACGGGHRRPASGSECRRFVATDSLKTGITWRVGDLLAEVPATNFDIIFLRNSLLTYYDEPLLTRSLRTVLTALRSSGLLIIGAHETIPATVDALVPVSGCPGVFEFRSDHR